MGRIYSVTINNQPMNGVKQLFEVVANDMPFRVNSLVIGCVGEPSGLNTSIILERENFSFGTLASGGFSATPVKMMYGDADPIVQCTVLNTDVPNLIRERAYMDVYSPATGFFYMPLPESRLVIGRQGLLSVQVNPVLTTGDITATLIIEEIN